MNKFAIALATAALFLTTMGTAQAITPMNSSTCEYDCINHSFSRFTDQLTSVVIKVADLPVCNPATGATAANLEGAGNVCVWPATLIGESPSTPGLYLYSVAATGFWGHSTFQLCPIDPVSGLWEATCQFPWWFSRSLAHETDLNFDGVILAQDLSRWFYLQHNYLSTGVDWLD